MPRTRWTLVLALASLTGCAACEDDALPGIGRIEVTPGRTLAVGVGDRVLFEARAWDVTGRAVELEATWRTEDEAVATIGADGTATAHGAGVVRVVAEASGVQGSAELEVWVPDPPAAYEPGVTYVGRAGYVEYVPGALPLVISVPHGGDRSPSEIADRTWGTMVTDNATIETALAVRDALLEGTGLAPHLVLSRLRRTKLDPNRELEEAAQGDPFAELAWEEFHGFIETARTAVTERFGRGLYVDLHGHGHAVPRVEVGYLLSAETLSGTDAELDAGGAAASSSVRALAASVPMPFSELLRGPHSLGALLTAEGFAAVPSPGDPSPGSEPYFSGGYATRRHGSLTGGGVDGVQLELHAPGLRDTESNRRAFGDALARAVEAFVSAHYGYFVEPPGP